jgi:hypothetical protein
MFNKFKIPLLIQIQNHRLDAPISSKQLKDNLKHADISDVGLSSTMETLRWKK